MSSARKNLIVCAGLLLGLISMTGAARADRFVTATYAQRIAQMSPQERAAAKASFFALQSHRQRYGSDASYRYRTDRFVGAGGTHEQFAELHPFVQANFGSTVITIGMSKNLNNGATSFTEGSRTTSTVAEALTFSDWLKR